MVLRKYTKYLYIILFEMFNTNFETLCYLSSNNNYLGPNIVPTMGHRCVSVTKLSLSSHACPNVFLKYSTNIVGMEFIFLSHNTKVRKQRIAKIFFNMGGFYVLTAM